MNLKTNNMFLFFMIMLCCSCMDIDTNEKEEMYVVYDDSWRRFVGSYNPNHERKAIEEGYELVIKDPSNYYRLRVYRRPFNRRYWFIGKFFIDKDKNISFVPITSSKKFDEKIYKEEDIKSIKSTCGIASANLPIDEDAYLYPHSAVYGIYYDIKKKEFIWLSKKHPKYPDYFLFSLGHNMPQYLVINPEYGKQLMEDGIILPDHNELKDNIVWQDWYNYWGLTDYKIEIP